MPKKTKILFVITKSNWGGAQRYVYDLAASLPSDRFDVAVAAGERGLLIDRLRQAGIRTISVRHFARDVNPLHELRAFRELLHIYKTERPEIIHLNSSKAGALGALAATCYRLSLSRPYLTLKAALRLVQVLSFTSLYPKPYTLNPRVVFTAHGWGFKEDRNSIVRGLIFFASWFAALFQNHIIVLATSDLASALRFIPRRKLSYIPLGITPIDFHNRQDARALLEKQIGKAISPDAFLVGTIAELTPNKGLSYLIDAIIGNPPIFAKATADKPSQPSPTDRGKENNGSFGLQAILIGDGELEDSLRARVLQNNLQDRVMFAGFVPNAARLLSAFDACVLPSLKEGLPYGIMEAMATGVPVIATHVGGIPDLIEHEQSGILVAPKNPRALADGISRIVRDAPLRAELAKRAKERILNEFTVEKMVTKTSQLYDDILTTINSEK